MRSILILIVAAGFVFGGGSTLADDPRLDFLKNLAGTWVGEPHHEGDPPTRFEFRVTAGGHAVEAREMAGSPMEMLTVYHLDGSDLVGTHYCMLGNQPRVIAAERIEKDTLRFECSGTPGNETSHDAEHIHGWTIRVDGDTMHYQTNLMADGKSKEASGFKLQRQR